MKTAMITGVTGQDGGYLSKFLLEKGYQVIGIVRSLNSINLRGLKYLGVDDKVQIEQCDLLDVTNISRLLEKYKPDELYNLAAQSSVAMSFAQPFGTIDFNLLSVLNILESLKRVSKQTKFYQASSSEMFGKVMNLPITENTTMHPLSPYGISKAAAHWTTIHYREAFGLFASCGILFNHESYLRNENYFIKKVIRNSLEIASGKKKLLKLGNIDVRRDFGYAPEYVKVMWLMLQAETPDDFIICSGRSISLREIVQHVLKRLDIPEEVIVTDPDLYRPVDILDIYGNPQRAKDILNWDYQYDFMDVVDILVDEEIKYFSND